ncbi:hypothetical protein KKC97_08015 [bacterium]|nr:hypothetical protein [bacterium]
MPALRRLYLFNRDRLLSDFLKIIAAVCAIGVLAIFKFPLPGIEGAEIGGQYPAIMVLGGLLGFLRGGVMALLYLAGRYILLPTIIDGEPDWWQLYGANGG